MNKLVLALAMFAMLVLAACTQTPTGKAVEEQVIKIGFVGPLTGDAAPYGITERNAVALAVNEINAAGGINGRTLEVIYEDGRCNGKDAANAANKLINIDKVKVILGGACSSETLAMAPITEDSKVILFSSFSSSPEVSKAGDYVFRNSPSDQDGGLYTAKLMGELGYENVVAISENTDYALAYMAAFKEHYEKQGGMIVHEDVFETGTTDFKSMILKAQGKDADAVLLNPQTSNEAALLAKQMVELGNKKPLIGNFIFGFKETLDAAGNAFEGMIFLDGPDVSSTNPVSADFLEEYTSNYGAPAHNWLAAAKYDAANIIAKGLQTCGEDTDCIRDYLYAARVNGIAGNYTFDSNGDVVGVPYAIRQIREGKPVLR